MCVCSRTCAEPLSHLQAKQRELAERKAYWEAREERERLRREQEEKERELAKEWERLLREQEEKERRALEVGQRRREERERRETEHRASVCACVTAL